MKQKILDEITDYYLNSKDFNGLSLRNLNTKDINLLEELIDEESIEILSCRFVINPHIRMYNLNVSREEQKEELKDNINSCVLYPSKKYLDTLNLSNHKPFTEILMKGSNHLDLIFFKMDILESYFQDPRYHIFFGDYRGTIVTRDKYTLGNYDDIEYIKDFGIAYSKSENRERCIGVFIGDLSDLSLYDQMKWKKYMLPNQENYYINSSFYKNTILGQWTDKISVYDAILDEMKLINKLCNNMKLPKLFKIEFSNESYEERPDYYRMMFLPTLKNYHDFVMVLEKMFVDNINVDTFKAKGVGLKTVNPYDKKGKKASIRMFSEWLDLNIINGDMKPIIQVLKDIRKERQLPAHKIIENEYSKEFYKKQDELIKKVYRSMTCIRLLLSNHPVNRNIKIPSDLKNQENIVLY